MLSHAYPPALSGVSLVVQKVARAMVRRGHSVSVIAASHHGRGVREEDEGVILERVRSWPNPYWSEGRLPISSRKRYREIVDAVNPDIVHSHEAVLGYQLASDVNGRQVPKVVTCHFLPGFITRYIGWINSLKRPIEKTAWEIGVQILNHYDRVVFANNTHLKAFIDNGLQVPTAIISNGVDTKRYQPILSEDGDIARRYKLPEGPRILFVGRIARDKEIDVLINAMAQPSAKHNAHLFIVGRGDDTSRLQKLTQSAHLEHCVHFLGYVPEDDLPGLYRQIDVFAIAATVEVQSIPTLQAIATAKPVVAVDAASLPELVHSGNNGYLVPPKDPQAMGMALCKIIEDPERARRFGDASLAISREHDEQATFDGYETLYKQLIAEKTQNTTR
jgi:glycosyltransferase involved in cell wall biosynthesis